MLFGIWCGYVWDVDVFNCDVWIANLLGAILQNCKIGWICPIGYIGALTSCIELLGLHELKCFICMVYAYWYI